MKIPVVYLNFNPKAPSNGYWDMTLITDIVEGKVWKPVNGYEYEIYTDKDYVTNPAGGAIVIIPASANKDYVFEINTYLADYDWCVVILTSDEERSFDLLKLHHRNMKLWLEYPTPNDNADMYLPIGYTPNIRAYNSRQPVPDKKTDWFFSGQVNHERRLNAAEVLKRMATREDISGRFNGTDGFTQGLEQSEYYKALLDAKIVPSPSGVQSPDSFRLYEALECGAVPVADDLSTLLVRQDGFFNRLFGEPPFKVYNDTEHLEGYIMDSLRNYNRFANNVGAWWLRFKRNLAYKLAEDIHELSGIPYSASDSLLNKVTIVIVSSPIHSHPSTEVIDRTIKDMRKVLPNCEILIGLDGIREEQEHYRENYEEYTRRLIWKCNNEWENVVPIVIADKHLHQVKLTNAILDHVKTPTIMFVEHDTALTNSKDLPLEAMVDLIETGEAYTIRFHFEAFIPEEHRYMMIDGVEDVAGVPMIKTYQWSQRPHLSSVAFYRDMLRRYFTEDSLTMIEDVIHGAVVDDYEQFGIMGWHKWRLWIYHPEENIKRSYTSDGRGSDPKYEMRFR